MKDRLVVVTGAGSGLGLAVTKIAARQGARVAALDVNDVTGNKVARETGAHFIHCDVAENSDWMHAAERIQEIGVPHYLFLNAGIQVAEPDADLSEYQFQSVSLANYEHMLGVNVGGVVLGLKALLPLMRDGGAIVVTSSLAGLLPYAVDPLYSMTKHAVAGLVRSLGRELAKRNININAICPGGIDTAIIPHQQRAGAVFMSPDNVADEVVRLFETEETGRTWAKLSDERPAFIVKPARIEGLGQ